MNKKIQILRAFAIFAVVMIHSNVGGILGVIDRTFLNFCVGMFIFISGYLTKIEIDDLKGFYKKRIVKVFIPYVIWTAAYSVLTGNLSSIVKLLITADASAQLYYIYVYIQLVILTPFIGKLLKSKYKHFGWLISPVYILIIRYICTVADIPVGFPFPETVCLGWFIFYYLRMSLGNNIIEYRYTYKKSIRICLIGVLLSEIEGLIWFYCGQYDMATTQIRLTSMIFAISVILVSYKYLTDDKIVLKDNTLSRLFVLIGDYSFGIFFSHIAIWIVLSKIPGIEYLIFPFSSVVILACSTVLVHFSRKLLGNKVSSFLGL